MLSLIHANTAFAPPAGLTMPNTASLRASVPLMAAGPTRKERKAGVEGTLPVWLQASLDSEGKGDPDALKQAVEGLSDNLAASLKLETRELSREVSQVAKVSNILA